MVGEGWRKAVRSLHEHVMKGFYDASFGWLSHFRVRERLREETITARLGHELSMMPWGGWIGAWEGFSGRASIYSNEEEENRGQGDGRAGWCVSGRTGHDDAG